MKQSLASIALGALLLSQSVLAGLYSSKDHVVEVTAQNFDAEVMNSDHLVMVEFYAPWCGHCKNLVPHYKAAAKNLHGIVKMAAIDCDDDKNRPTCSQYDIKGFPTIKVFPVNRNSKKGVKYPKDYQGERSAKAMVDFLIPLVPNDIKLVTSNPSSEKITNIDEFSANESEPRALLFTKKLTSSNMYKGLATDMKDRMIVAEMRAPSDEVLKKYKIDLPALVVFPKGSQESIMYTGELKRDPLLEFMNQYAESAKTNKKSTKSTAGSASTPSPKPTVAEFDPKISQIVDQAQFSKECLSKTQGSCVIAFFVYEPEFPESEQIHQENLEILRKVKKAAYDANKPLSIMWMDALDKRVTDFRDLFQISSDIPGLFLINPKKKVYLPFIGQFDVEGIQGWLSGVASRPVSAIRYTFDVTLGESKATEEKTEEKKIKDEL